MKIKPAFAALMLQCIALSCVLQACATASESHFQNTDTEQAEPAAETAAEEADVTEPQTASEAIDLDDAEVMYNVFAGELLGSDGNLEGAVSAYLEAAMESDDPAIAQRATRVALAAQSWFQAAMAADRWALLAPDDMAAREAAAATMLATQDYAGAELQLSEILKRNPDREDGWAMVTALLAQASDPEKASELLRSLIDANEGAENHDAIFVQAQLLARMGEFEQAASFADQALALTPERVELLTFSGRLALSMDDLDTAVERFGRAWAVAPENHDLGLAYADLLARAARADEAREVLKSMDQTPDVVLSRVLFEISANDPERAQEVYEEFDDLRADDPNELAFFHAQAAEAIGALDEAIELYGSVGEGRYQVMAGIHRAELIADGGDLEAARDALEELREIADDQTAEQAWMTEARLLREAGETQEAFQTLGLALEEFGYSIPIRYSHALLASDLGNIEITEYDLRIVLADDPDNAAALNALGYTLADQTDRYSEAETLIRRAHELQPDDPSILDSMGWVAYRLGRLEEAESYLRRAWELDQNPEIAAHLGEVLWTMGMPDAAMEVWREGLEQDGEHPVLEATIQRLDVEL